MNKSGLRFGITAKRLFLLFMMLHLVWYGWGQDINMDVYRPLQPQAWAFMKYGGHAPDLYTGTVQVSVPVYTYKDNDFNIPVAFSYASSGYQPNQPQGSMGLGWNLDAGGTVTREIRGIPDDYHGVYNGEPSRGYFYYHQYYKEESSLSQIFAQNKDVPWRREPYFYLITDKENVRNYFEAQSDVYSFKFGDHRGKFVLAPNGKIHVYDTNHPAGEYKVELFEGDLYGIYDKPGILTIVITTGDGYAYMFGGPRTNEHSTYVYHEGENNLFSLKNPEFYRNNWLLAAITAPNGRQAAFNYTTVKNILSYTPTVKDYSLGNYVGSDSDNYDCNYEAAYHKPSFPTNVYEYFLREIVIGANKISFSYDAAKYSQYYRNLSRTVLENGLFKNERAILSKVEVSNQLGNVVSRHSLSYKYTNGNPTPMLKSVELMDGTRYKMDYYKENESYPDYGTIAVDYMGYFNGLKDEYGTSIMQKTDSAGAIYGMLRKIGYPTGGYSTFDYEPNDYSQIITRRDEISCPFLKPTGRNYIAAGLRIKRITDHSCVKTAGDSLSVREFEYSTAGVSNGISLHYPRGVFRNGSLPGPFTPISRIDVTPDYRGKICIITCMYSMLYIDRTHIEYAKVRERKGDGSFVEYDFSNYSDTPDSWENVPTINIYRSPGSGSTSGMINLIEPISLHTHRGKLLATRYYNPAGELVLTRENLYDKSVSLPYIEEACGGNDYYYLHKQYSGCYPLLKSVEKQHFGGSPFVTEKTFAYNAFQQPTRILTTGANGRTIQEDICYVSDDNSSPQPSIISGLRGERMLGKVTRRTISERWDPSLAKIIQSVRYIYGVINFIHESGIQYFLEKVETADIVTPQSSAANLVYRTDLSFDNHNMQGKPTQITDRNGIKTCYIWGYGGMYPVAKLTNATVGQISLSTSKPLEAGLNDAQKRQLNQIPGAYVEFYDYIPLVGITKTVDASGLERIYEYNSHYKLKNIRDGENNIITSYEYSAE